MYGRGGVEPLAWGVADGVGENTGKLGVASEAGVEGLLEKADFWVGMESPKKFLQAEAVAVSGNGQSGLFLEKGTKIERREVDSPGQFGLREVLVRVGQQGESGFQFGVEGGAVFHGLSGTEFVPECKKRKVKSAVERVGSGEGGDGGEEPIHSVQSRSSQATAKGMGGLARGRCVVPSGFLKGLQTRGLPFDNPQEHVGGPFGWHMALPGP